MRKFIKIAWRNIWRNRRRSLITMAAIVFAVLISGITRSLQYGTYDALESYAVRLLVGELQIQRAGFQDKQTLAYAFPEDVFDWDDLLQQYPYLVTYAKRITGFGLVGSEVTSAGAMILGVQPDREIQVTHFMKQLAAGEPLEPGDDRLVLLGKTLAKNLQVGIGDTVVVLTQGYHNELGADSYVVKGLVRSGNIDLDRALMVMPLHNAQELFFLGNRITQVVFLTRDFRRADGFARQMNLTSNGLDFVCLSWEKLMPELVQLIAWDNVSGAIFLVFLLIIVGFEILNTTLMAIMERVREFGILQAIGVKPRQLGLMLLLETGFKITMALMTGLLLTFVVIQIVKNYPIPLSGELKKMMEAWGFLTDFYFTSKPRVYLEPLIAVALISVLSILYPIRVATRLIPVEALRRT